MRLRRDRLRELRRARKLTQAQIAIAVGCARSTVSTWETSGSMPRPAVLRYLAKALGTTVADLTEPGGPPSLRALRTAAGMRQVDIARMLGVGTPTYCDVETGRQKIPTRWIPLLARALDVLPDSLRELTATRKNKTSHRNAIRQQMNPESDSESTAAPDSREVIPGPKYRLTAPL
ncbi:helix-turn-helix transcriptional regulator [Streptomyces tsukubensis]|uniref:helix-turn-helix transcriptional regulator n=1 Tax=Streptomyces tsukubensis TaxID=83656 RepID=UPI00344C0489